MENKIVNPNMVSIKVYMGSLWMFVSLTQWIHIYDYSADPPKPEEDKEKAVEKEEG